MMMIDVNSNRAAAKYTAREQSARVVWSGVKLLFRKSPRPCFAWRRALLRAFGAKVGAGVNVYPSATIYFPWNLRIEEHSAIGEDVLIYNLGLVTIGARVTISHRSHICAGTHDYTRQDFPLLKPPISVGSDAWVCADAFLGPGVCVGDGAIVGARAAVFRDVRAWTIVGGNPAKVIGSRLRSISELP